MMSQARGGGGGGGSQVSCRLVFNFEINEWFAFVILIDSGAFLAPNGRARKSRAGS